MRRLRLWLCLWMLSVPCVAAENSVTFELEASGGPEEQTGKMPVERIFQNPAMASGLSNGLESLNRSIDSLMEGMFYGLLDNELVYNMSDAVEFKAKLDREVHTVNDGSYVIVDRFSVGPQYGVPLTSIHSLPLNLGAEGTINVMDIYLRSDGMRLAEEAELSTFRKWANNWFGLLPILTRVLPPSFNPNELYDPIRQVTTPFHFSLDEASFKAMPVGSIRSFSFNGTVSVALDFLSQSVDKIRSHVGLSDQLEVTLPYTVFKTGEHRISILKKSDNIFWVGLTDLNRMGHGISSSLGQAAKVFAKVTPYWGGMPVLLFPVDLETTLADANKFDLLYSFDLSNPEANEAYLKAVRGDFTKAQEKYSEARAYRKDTGVEFQFDRREASLEHSGSNSRNLFVFRSSRHDMRAKSRIETLDQLGRFHMLEVNQQVQDETWDALVGVETLSFNNRAAIKVSKVTTPEGDVDYTFRKGDRSPYDLTLSLSINDRFIDVLEFRSYIELVRFFTRMPLYDIPYLPLRQEEKLVDRRRETAVENPTEDVENIHVTPTYLGSFGADASVYLSTDDLNAVAKHDEDELWDGFAKAYNLPEGAWETADDRWSVLNGARWANSFLLYPLRLFNLRFATVDAVREAYSAIEAIKAFKAAQTPEQKLAALDDLLNTNHPAYLSRALMLLSNNIDISRSVAFHTKAKGSYGGITRELYESLNRKIFRLGGKFPALERGRVIREKLAEFEPTNLREQRDRPIVKSIRLLHQPKGVTKDGEQESDLRAEIELIAKENGPARIYLRFDEGGRMNVGRFVLAETVAVVAPQKVKSLGGKKQLMTYEVVLSGNDSVMDDFMLEHPVNTAGLFDLSLALSLDGQVWSEEHKVSFAIANGQISKVVGKK